MVMSRTSRFCTEKICKISKSSQTLNDIFCIKEIEVCLLCEILISKSKVQARKKTCCESPYEKETKRLYGDHFILC